MKKVATLARDGLHDTINQSALFDPSLNTNSSNSIGITPPKISVSNPFRPFSKMLPDMFQELEIGSPSSPGRLKLQDSTSLMHSISANNTKNADGQSPSPVFFHNPNVSPSSIITSTEQGRADSSNMFLSGSLPSSGKNGSGSSFQRTSPRRYHLFPRISGVKSRIRDKMSIFKMQSPSSLSYGSNMSNSIGSGEAPATVVSNSDGEPLKLHAGKDLAYLSANETLQKSRNSRLMDLNDGDNSPDNNKFTTTSLKIQQQLHHSTSPDAFESKLNTSTLLKSASPLGSPEKQHIKDPSHISYVANRGSTSAQGALNLLRATSQTTRCPSFVEAYEPVSAYGVSLPSSNSDGASSNYNSGGSTRQNLFVAFSQAHPSKRNELQRDTTDSIPSVDSWPQTDKGYLNKQKSAETECQNLNKDNKSSVDYNMEESSGYGSIRSNQSFQNNGVRAITMNTLRRLRSLTALRADKGEFQEKYTRPSTSNGDYNMGVQGDSEGADNVVDWCLKMTPNSYYLADEDQPHNTQRRAFIRKLSRSSSRYDDGRHEHQGFGLSRARSRIHQKGFYEDEFIDQDGGESPEIYQDAKEESRLTGLFRRTSARSNNRRHSWASRAPSDYDFDWNEEEYGDGYTPTFGNIDPTFASTVRNEMNDITAGIPSASSIHTINGLEVAGRGPYSLMADVDPALLSRNSSFRTVRSSRSCYSNTTTSSSKSSAGGNGTFAQRTVLRSKINTNGDEERMRIQKMIEEEAHRDNEKEARRKKRREERDRSRALIAKQMEAGDEDTHYGNEENHIVPCAENELGYGKQKQKQNDSGNCNLNNGKRSSSNGTAPRVKKRQKKSDSVRRPRSTSSAGNGRITIKARSTKVASKSKVRNRASQIPFASD